MKRPLLSPQQMKEAREMVKRTEIDKAWGLWNRHKYRLAREEFFAKKGEFNSSVDEHLPLTRRGKR